MVLNDALKIFYDIDNKAIPILDKGAAIRRVLEMETKNSISRNDYIKVIEWLWNQLYMCDMAEGVMTHDLGAWIPIDDAPHEDYECSRCGKLISCEYIEEEYAFCPKCGQRKARVTYRDDVVRHPVDLISAIPEIPMNECGVVHSGRCLCGGIIEAYRDPATKHMRAKCNLCGFTMVE